MKKVFSMALDQLYTSKTSLRATADDEAGGVCLVVTCLTLQVEDDLVLDISKLTTIKERLYKVGCKGGLSTMITILSAHSQEEIENVHLLYPQITDSQAKLKMERKRSKLYVFEGADDNPLSGSDGKNRNRTQTMATGDKRDHEINRTRTQTSATDRRELVNESNRSRTQTTATGDKRDISEANRGKMLTTGVYNNESAIKRGSDEEAHSVFFGSAISGKYHWMKLSNILEIDSPNKYMDILFASDTEVCRRRIVCTSGGNIWDAAILKKPIDFNMEGAVFQVC